MLGGRLPDLESHDLGKNSTQVGHRAFGCSNGLAWEREDLIPAISTSLFQANSNKNKVEVLYMWPSG